MYGFVKSVEIWKMFRGNLSQKVPKWLSFAWREVFNRWNCNCRWQVWELAEMKTEETDRPSCMFAKDYPGSSFRHETCKLKRKRVHVPHSKRPKEFVVKRNSKERQRVGEMANAFDTLMSVLPSSASNSKPSRIEVLRDAIDYIHKLERKLIDGDNTQTSEICYCNIGEAQKKASNGVWMDSRVGAMSGSINNIELGKQTVDLHCDVSSRNFVGVSSTENGSVIREAGLLGYAFPNTAETNWDESMPMLNASQSFLEPSQTRNEQPVYLHDTFHGPHEQYSHVDMMHDSHVNNTVFTYSEIHMNASTDTRQRLVDITNWQTRAHHNSYSVEMLKPMVSASGPLHDFDRHNTGQRRGVDMCDAQSGPLQGDLVNHTEENNTRFYSIF